MDQLLVSTKYDNAICILYCFIGGGVDYVSESYNVTFHAGETDVTLNISIIDDDILENDENFIVTVTLIPINVVIASNTGYSTVTIMDNDGK